MNEKVIVAIDIADKVGDFIIESPEMIFLFAYFIVLYIVCKWDIKKHGYEWNGCKWNECTEGRKKHIARTLIGLITGSVVCWFSASYFDGNSKFMELCDDYLRFEPILAITLFICMISALFTTGNRYKHVAVINKVVQYLLIGSVGIHFILRQVDLLNLHSWIVLGFICACLYQLLVTDCEIVKVNNLPEKANYDIPYGPADSLEQLFPQHKAQAKRIANMILDSSSEPFSICLSGEWGTGKTSVMTGVEEILRDKGKGKYEFIHINAMELDDKKTLFDYFMSEVKSCLEDRGIYTGVASEYKDFLMSTVGSVTSKSLGTFLQKKIFGHKKGYREQKKELEQLLAAAFSDGKLILVVDDIERCQHDIAREYLFLIKEVATMKNCISIFVTSYEVLLNLLETNLSEKDNPNKKSVDFLKKFFNSRIDLYDEAPEDIFEYFDGSFNETDPAFNSIFCLAGMSPGTWYKHTLEELGAQIEEQEEKNRQYHLSEEEHKQAQEMQLQRKIETRKMFIQLMQNSRNAVGFCNAYRRNMYRCYNDFWGKNLSSEKQEQVKEYLYSRNIGNIVSFISFIEVYLPDELQQIIQKGARYIDTHWSGETDSSNKTQRLLREIAKVSVFNESTGSPQKRVYIKQEMNWFIERFLEPNADLYQLVNTFTTQEEAWIDAIENENVAVLDSDWFEIVRMVLEKVPNDNSEVTSQWKIDKFEKLLAFADKQTERNRWTLEKIFSVFQFNNSGRLFATSNGFMQVFWEYLQHRKGISVVKVETLDGMLAFAREYSYYRVGSLYDLFKDTLADPGDIKVDKLQEHLLNANNSNDDNFLMFVNAMTRYIPSHQLTSNNWLEKYKCVATHIRNKLENNSLMGYKDIKEKVDDMMNSIDELHCFDQFMKYVQKYRGNTYEWEISPKDFQQVDKTIQHFNKVFRREEKHFDNNTEKSFMDFLNYLSYSDEITLTKQQGAEINVLITKFITLTDRDCALHRIRISKKVLIEESEIVE